MNDSNDPSDLQALWDLDGLLHDYQHLSLVMKSSAVELNVLDRKVQLFRKKSKQLILSDRESELIIQSLKLATICAAMQIAADAAASLTPPAGSIPLTSELQADLGVELNFDEGPS